MQKIRGEGGGAPSATPSESASVNDNKQIWKKVKPFFSDKGVASSNIVLKVKGNLIIENQKLASFFNSYVINITDILQLQKNQNFL